MAYLGNDPSTIIAKARKAYVYTASAGQTVFSGSDDNGETLSCTVDTFVNVYLNGVRLIKGDDFTLGANALTLVSGAVLGDEITIVSDVEASVYNTYTRSETDTKITDSVQTAVSGLLDAAPAQLDTLNELAAALNNDANFASTVTSSLASKANLSGATFTGDVKATGLTAGSVNANSNGYLTVGTNPSTNISATIVPAASGYAQLAFDTPGSQFGTSAYIYSQYVNASTSNLSFGTVGSSGVMQFKPGGTTAVEIGSTATTFNGDIRKKISFSTGVETNILKLDDGAGNYGGRISTYNNGGYNQDLRIYTTDASGNNEKLHAVLNGKTRSLQTFGQQYATWVESMQTIDGGLQNVRVLEDCYGRWLVVGKFAADASTAISATWSTVRGLSTSTSQSDTTAFSADFGSTYPTEVRILGATDFERWRDTRTVDWVYRVPSGRNWASFFNNGSSNMDQNTGAAGVSRYGFGVAGAYDGFGRWNNPAMTWMGMSDTATSNPSAAYSTPTANAINWYSTGSDAKLSVIHSGAYAGQDANATSSFGYDDTGNNFFDAFPSVYSNHSGTKMFTSAVWILIKLN